MPFLRVKITEIVDESFPTFVRCQFSDAEGALHSIVEKLPVLQRNYGELSPNDLPMNEYIACTLEDVIIDTKGNKLAQVNTAIPHAIESEDGATIFIVLRSEVFETDPTQ